MDCATGKKSKTSEANKKKCDGIRAVIKKALLLKKSIWQKEHKKHHYFHFGFKRIICNFYIGVLEEVKRDIIKPKKAV